MACTLWQIVVWMISQSSFKKSDWLGFNSCEYKINPLLTNTSASGFSPATTFKRSFSGPISRLSEVVNGPAAATRVNPIWMYSTHSHHPRTDEGAWDNCGTFTGMQTYLRSSWCLWLVPADTPPAEWYNVTWPHTQATFPSSHVNWVRDKS